MRPKEYNYFQQLKDHLGDLGRIFNGELIYPRQLEIHLPGDGVRHCNLNCFYCQGRALDRSLAPYEEDVLQLLDKLEGACPFNVYGGAYSEPLLNPYFLRFLQTTKRTGSLFGIHTNGTLLLQREKAEGFLSELVRISDSPLDYLSISLDAGTPESHMKAKRVSINWFDEIIEGIRMAVQLRGNSDKPAIRVCFLMNEHNSSPEEIRKIVDIVKDIGADSLRFSIPYFLYGKDFEVVRKYKHNVEIGREQAYLDVISPYFRDANPLIFYISPESQDVDKMTFKQCIYNYFQISISADGYIYRCSSTASGSFKFNRVGEASSDLDEFNGAVLNSHNPTWRPERCFRAGARCNRLAVEINSAWEELNGKRSA